MTYIAEAMNGEGVRNNGPIILDMLGYNPDGAMYEFDLEQVRSRTGASLGRRPARDRLPLLDRL